MRPPQLTAGLLVAFRLVTSDAENEPPNREPSISRHAGVSVHPAVRRHEYEG